MALVADQTYNMFPRHEQDFMLYPDSSHQAGFASPVLDMHMSPHGYSGIPRSVQDGFPRASGFEAGPIYPDQHNFVYNNRTSPGTFPEETGMTTAALSTTSAPSATSSTQAGLGVNPSIAGSGEYYSGTEYNAFSMPGTEDFSVLDNKIGFVGESAQVSIL
ncbi:hypothetical protein M426DRAFT_141869 [Hypoxylon sp. CI-4A]|nr:hypothetical protein M426DRAFT_141869 [Hypoxylon sp. CI-4A]